MSASGKGLRNFNIRRGLFLGGSLLPLLLVLCMIPLTLFWKTVKAHNDLEKKKIKLSHLLFTDDLKLIGKSYNQIYTLDQNQYMICGYQDILGQEIHRRKIAKIHKDFWIIQSFHNFMPKNIVIPRDHTILMRTKSIFNPSANFYHFPTLY